MESSLPGKNPLEKFMTWVATGFGLGMIAPIAPGTVGSIPGVLLSCWTTTFPVLLQIIVCLGLTFLAVPFCDVAERVLQKKDDGRICADEWMLFPTAVIGLPILEKLWLLPICFVVARIVDVIKPPPARKLQEIPGGKGIVIDDFFASLYSLAINWGIYYLIEKFMQE